MLAANENELRNENKLLRACSPGGREPASQKPFSMTLCLSASRSRCCVIQKLSQQKCRPAGALAMPALFLPAISLPVSFEPLAPLVAPAVPLPVAQTSSLANFFPFILGLVLLVSFDLEQKKHMYLFWPFG